MHSSRRASRYLWLWILFSIKASAQDAVATLHYADFLFDQKQYESALLSYQRVLFFNPGNVNTDCYIRMADCYSAIDSLHKSNACYDLAYFSTENDSIKDALLFKRIENLIILKEYKIALQDIYAVEISSATEQRKADFYQACIHYGLNDFAGSEHYFSILFDSTQAPDLYMRYKKILKELRHVNNLNPNAAMIMSIIIPGTGQFYAGDFKNGLNSITVTSLFMYITIRSVMAVGILEGMTTAFPLYYRYYTGGYKRAKAIAEERKNYRRARVYQKLLRLYEDYELSVK